LGEKTLDTVHRFSLLGEKPRQLIAIRLDVGVLRWLKSLAAKRRIPYQSLINELLAGEMRKAG
jgi:predicted DNA binding CopG/RHH family protein